MDVTRSCLRARRWWFIGSLIISIVICVLLSRFHWGRVWEIPNLGLTTITVVPGVHMLCGLGPSPAYVVETPEGPVLIDSGLESNASPVKSELAKLGLNWNDLRAIFLTHAHGDHTGGAEHLREATKATVYAGQGDVSVLRAGSSRAAFFSTFYMPNHSPHPTTVDVELEGDEVISFGDISFRVLATPGHSPGSVCYLLERSGLRLLFGGDVIMHPGKSNSVGTYTAYLAPCYRGDASAFRRSLQKLRAIRAPDLVLPGHPRQDPPQNPRMTQQSWETMLDEGIHEIETLLARYQADGADFLDGQPKQLLPDFYYLGNFKDTAVYGFFSLSKFFVVNAPGGSGLADFLKAALQELGVQPAVPAAVLLTSCGPRQLAGIPDLVEKCHTRVVASSLGLAHVKEVCPLGTTILSTDDLPRQNWFDVRPILLRGRGLGQVAYVIPWAGKTVLLTGQIPAGNDQALVEGLLSALLGSRADVIDYLVSINQLDGINPDLWLPAVPSDGQNANLYDRAWNQIIANDYHLGYVRLNRNAPRRGL
jgi:glyoxylase-like metal-dependent hydrolase (beta-lactamase superfamily II)